MADDPRNLSHLEWADDSGAINALFFDAVVNETIDYTATITQFPVESGATITDHSQAQPITVFMQAVVSDTPVRNSPSQVEKIDKISGKSDTEGVIKSVELEIPEPPALQQALQAGRTIGTAAQLAANPGPGAALQGASLIGDVISGLLEPSPSATVLFFDGFTNRIINVFKALEDLLNKAILVRVVTQTKSFENMLLESFNAPRTNSDGSSLTFSLTLRQVSLVENEFTTEETLPKAPSGKKEKSDGKKSASESLASAADAVTIPVLKSVL